MLPTGKHKPEMLGLLGTIIDDIRGRALDAALESRLNERFGAGSDAYQNLRRLLELGIDEGWVAYVDIQGAAYRRGCIAEPAAQTAELSVESGLLENVKGQYHCHTLGEINMIMPIDADANFCGHGAGWKVFPPMSEHFPTVKGRALMMYFLPQGRIEYKAPPAGMVL